MKHTRNTLAVHGTRSGWNEVCDCANNIYYYKTEGISTYETPDVLKKEGEEWCLSEYRQKISETNNKLYYQSLRTGECKYYLSPEEKKKFDWSVQLSESAAEASRNTVAFLDEDVKIPDGTVAEQICRLYLLQHRCSPLWELEDLYRQRHTIDLAARISTDVIDAVFRREIAAARTREVVSAAVEHMKKIEDIILGDPDRHLITSYEALIEKYKYHPAFAEHAHTSCQESFIRHIVDAAKNGRVGTSKCVLMKQEIRSAFLSFGIDTRTCTWHDVKKNHKMSVFPRIALFAEYKERAFADAKTEIQRVAETAKQFGQKKTEHLIDFFSYLQGKYARRLLPPEMKWSEFYRRNAKDIDTRFWMFGMFSVLTMQKLFAYFMSKTHARVQKGIICPTSREADEQLSEFLRQKESSTEDVEEGEIVSR